MTMETLAVDRPWLMLGDCLERMAEIQLGSVDMVLADLPYGTTACAWDSVIPFGPLWDYYRLLVKPFGAVVLFASQPFTASLVMSNPDWFKYALVWEKENGSNFYNARHQPLKVHEDIAVFSPAAASYSRRGNMVYRPQLTEGIPYRPNNTTKGLMQFHSAPPGRKSANTGTRYPRSVLRFQTEKGLHPTQKPVSLLEYLIRTYTNEGEIVLDNTAGSFSTGLACINTGRRFIGIEKDQAYFDVGRCRIDAAIAAASKPAPQGGLFDSQAAE